LRRSEGVSGDSDEVDIDGDATDEMGETDRVRLKGVIGRWPKLRSSGYKSPPGVDFPSF